MGVRYLTVLNRNALRTFSWPSHGTTMKRSTTKIPLKERPVLRLKLGPASVPAPTPAPVTAASSKSVSAPTAPPSAAPRELEASEARQERAFRMRDALIERWPNCFKGPEQPKLPLKIGIHRDIKAIAPELSTRDLGTAIRYYVGDYQYRQAMVAGAVRFDLDGNPAGVVAPDESPR
jgi:hypothetical protein